MSDINYDEVPVEAMSEEWPETNQRSAPIVITLEDGEES